MSEQHNYYLSQHQFSSAVEQDKELSTPRIVIGKGTEQDITVDEHAVANTMRDLGISEEAIATSAVYIDPKNRLINNGTHYSRSIGRRRFRSNKELQDVEGDIVRLTIRKRYKDRPTELMNKTLVHELEHLAQDDRDNMKVTMGHIAIWGLAAAGAVLGHKIGSRKGGVITPITTAVGAYIGHSIGYRVAPHERQARVRSGQVKGKGAEVLSQAVTRTSDL